MDRISELPSSLISQNILKFLPLSDAVRTSVLSRRWRFVWTSVPELLFDDSVGFKLGPAENIKRIFGILLLHQGPISTCELSIEKLTNYSDINKILIFLSRNGLENLTMTIKLPDISRRHKLPSYIYSCTQLKCLMLTNSIFKFIYPMSFRKLVTLQLFVVALPPVVSITDYPALEYLSLHCNTHIEKISINLPNLVDLDFSGRVDRISFIDTPLLKKFRWICHLGTECSFDLFRFLCSVPHIETLDLPNIFLKRVGRNAAQNLPATMDSIQSLHFSDLCLDARDELSSALWLIRSSPNIQRLSFTVFQATPCDSSIEEYLEIQKLSGITLNKVCIVTVEVATCGASELELIKFLLAIAPELERLDIWPSERESGDSYCKMLIKLARFSRVSRKAELIFHDYGYEEDDEEEEEDEEEDEEDDD